MTSRTIFEAPTKRRHVGAIVYSGWCAAMLAFVWDSSAVAVAMVAACLGGGVLFLVHQLRSEAGERSCRAEWARARLNWGDLRAGANSARASGRDLADYLRSHGYRSAAVLRAIAHELECEREHAAPPEPSA